MVFMARQRVRQCRPRSYASAHLSSMARAAALSAMRMTSRLAADSHIPFAHHTLAPAVKAPFPPRIRRRNVRQLEQRYGPMWRYKSLALLSVAERSQALTETSGDCPSSSCGGSVSPTTGGGGRANDGGDGASLDGKGEAHRLQLMARARVVGVIDLVHARPADCTAVSGVTVRASSETRATESSTMEPLGSDSLHGTDRDSEQQQHHHHHGINANTCHVAAAASMSTADPLMEFLEKNQDDAALLLAMWGSLRRSCLYGSEISESLALCVRYFFHCLLHRGAIAAALEWYHRLVVLGVQLKGSDLMLLLANLPYEHSAAAANRRWEWHEEAVREERDRARRAERARDVAEAEARSIERHRQATAGAVAAADAGASARITAKVTSDASDSKNPVANVPRADDLSPEPASSVGASLYAAGLDLSSIADPPGWVRRWVLYEASMGNIDLYGDEAISAGQSPTANTYSNAAREHSAVAIARAGHDTVTVKEDVGGQVASAALRMMEMASVLRHLHLLQMTSRLREDWVSKARVPEDDGGQQHHNRDDRIRIPAPARVRVASVYGPTASRAATHYRRHRGRHPRRSHQRTAEPAAPAQYWKEGVRLLRRFLESDVAATRAAKAPPSSVEPQQRREELAIHQNSHKSDSPRVLPPSVLGAAHDLVRTTNTWPAAYAFARVLAPLPPSGLHARDAVLLLRIGAPQQPWAHDTTVERFLDMYVLPQLPRDTAAAYAGQAIWLAHLCRVRAARTEAFLTLVAHAESMWSLPSGEDNCQDGCCTANSTGTSTAAGLMAVAIGKARLATSHLLLEVGYVGHGRRAREALAASVRSGVYAEDRELAQTPTAAVATADAMSGQCADSANGIRLDAYGDQDDAVSAAATSGALLPPALLDAYALCCEAVVQALSLALVSAVGGGASTATPQDCLESAVYGPFGLWATFAHVYLPPALTAGSGGGGGGGDSMKSNAHTAADARALARAPERPAVAALTARTLMRCATERCQYRREPGARGQVRLLLDLAVTALHSISEVPSSNHPSNGSSAEPSLDAAEVRALAEGLAALAGPLLHLLDLRRPDECAVFGLVDDDSVGAMAALARIAGKVESLHLARCTTHRPSHRLCVHGVRSPPDCQAVRPVLLPLLTPATRRLLMRVCYSRTNALGRRICSQLRHRELADLERALHTARRRGAAVSAANTGAVAGRAATPSLSPTRNLCSVSHECFVAVRNARERLYAAVLARRAEMTSDVSHAEKTLCRMLSEHVRGLASVRVVCDLLLRDVAAARGTVSLPFFTEAFDQMSADARAERGDVSTALSSFSRPSPSAHGVATVHRAGGGAEAAVSVPPLTWADGVWLFWAAVDHTGRGRQHVESARGATASTETIAAAHERVTMTALLLPMLSFSAALGQPDAGRQWRRQWASRFSWAERQRTEWQQRNVEALAVLGDPSALPRAAALFTAATAAATTSDGDASVSTAPTASLLCVHDRIDPSENGNGEGTSSVDGLLAAPQPHALLCAVARRHRSWEQALRTLFDAYGSLAAHEAAREPYPVDAVHALLATLERSPMNLSNTGLRLRTIQGLASEEGSEDAVWDVESAARLTRLLVRARRWRSALNAAQEALALPNAVSLRRFYTTPPLRRFISEGEADRRVQQQSDATPQEADVVAYAKLLVLAIQACAIGGQGDTATALYDELQAVVCYYRDSGCTQEKKASCDGATQANRPTEDGMDLLESALAKAHDRMSLTTRDATDAAARTSADAVEHCSGVSGVGQTRTVVAENSQPSKSLLQTLDALSSRARPLFFRAVTKKMMTAPARGESQPQKP